MPAMHLLHIQQSLHQLDSDQSICHHPQVLIFISVLINCFAFDTILKSLISDRIVQ